MSKRPKRYKTKRPGIAYGVTLWTVKRQHKGRSYAYTYWQARWKDAEGRQGWTQFSVKKLGNDAAYAAACEAQKKNDHIPK